VTDASAPEALREFLTALADDELLLGHRNSEWTGHAPILEEDIAFSNLAQDELGHALAWYTLAHALGASDPDHAVFFRDAPDFRNATLVELPRGDWAFTVVRQYLFDAAEQVRYAALAESAHRPIADTVAKLRREERYQHSRGWAQRLGDATEESHRRMQDALKLAWPHALGLFEPTIVEEVLVEVGVKPAEIALREQWLAQVVPVLEAATLVIPTPANDSTGLGGRFGRHTAHLAELLNEMQKVARMEPEAIW
jgi:ring-1,2-phenylacetyl-CoA epoxidase subunit PaaC